MVETQRNQNHWSKFVHPHGERIAHTRTDLILRRRKRRIGRSFTWCSAVNPSTFAVSMSTPFSMRCNMSSLSPDRQAARNTQPEENFTFRVLGSFGKFDARFVSESSHRFSCSARFDTAELLRASNDILNFTFFYLFCFSFIRLYFSICHIHSQTHTQALLIALLGTALLAQNFFSLFYFWCFWRSQKKIKKMNWNEKRKQTVAKLDFGQIIHYVCTTNDRNGIREINKIFFF